MGTAQRSGLDLTGERGDELRDRIVHTLGVIGWLTRGFAYLMIAGIVLKVATTGGTEPQTAFKNGALSTLVDRTGGMALVALLAAGAAWRGDSSSVHGIDGALRTVIGSPLGPFELVLIALGLAAFAGYCAAAAVSRPHEDG